ncbi:MAG: hypothetical protein AAFX02_04850 [Pseudomonadota bacterium]
MKKPHSKAKSIPAEAVATTYFSLLAIFATILMMFALSPMAHADTSEETEEKDTFEWLTPQSSQFQLDTSIYHPNKASLPATGDLISSSKRSDHASSLAILASPTLAYTTANFALPDLKAEPLRIFVPFAEHNFLNQVDTRTDAFAFGHDSRTGF